MPRYFIELSYNGEKYSGFQVQENANSVQAELEKALKTYFRTVFQLTGSSRTDAGVHALQNYFHFDTELPFTNPERQLYHLNAILPEDIVIRSVREVTKEAHCRFDALGREYHYHLYRSKDPFLQDRAYYFPYKLDVDLLNEAAMLIRQYRDFTSFSKRNTQVHSFICEISVSEWCREAEQLVYRVRGNRFLRGMVRGLVGTMLHVGKGKISLGEFEQIIKNRDCTLAKFDVPPHGLFLTKVEFLPSVFV